MSKLSHEIRELRDSIAKLGKQQEIVAMGVAKIIDLLKGGIKLEVRPPKMSPQPKILVAGPSVKVESRKRRSP